MDFENSMNIFQTKREWFTLLCIGQFFLSINRNFVFFLFLFYREVLKF